jgi:NitT/TauT family transport system substrate-binding protein
MRLLRGPAALAAVALTLAGAAGCGGSSSASSGSSGLDKSNLVVGAVATSASAGLYIAQQQGFFAHEGLHVTIKNVVSGATTIPDLMHGSLDVVSGNWVSFLAAQAKGTAKLHVLADGYLAGPHVEQVFALPNSGITKATDLKGKTVAINALKNVAELTLDSVLTEYGVAPGQVHFVPMPFPAMAGALSAHRIDAAWMAEPYATEAQEKLGAQVVFDCSQGATENLPVAGFVATAAWAKRYPKTAAAFTRAINKAQTLADSSRSAVEKALPPYVPGLTPQLASVISLGSYPITVDKARIQRIADLMQRFGLLQQRYDVSPMVS